MKINEEVFLKELGQRIAQLRKERNIKQVEFAAKLNIEDSALRRIESGRTNPTTKTLLRIAQELNLSMKELFDF